ncbi:MAG: DUF502 domain-containing protein [Gammaproteobacteria bacterium]|nr:DUF502 domain-containing protein [Gammaproteobacteria bacterium]
MRKYLIAGLLVWLPLGITLLVVKLLVDFMDRILLLLPPGWRPDALLGFHIPGLGFLLAFLIVLVTGIVVANLVGRKLVGLWEAVLARIPLVRTIYSAVKQVAETLLAPGGRSFRKVLLVEYPRKGMWSLAFETSGATLGEVQAKTGREEVVSVFVPTTPNPTSGYVVMLPRREIIELDMSVDEGMRFIISMGVAVPAWPQRAERPKDAVAAESGTP